MLPERVLVDVVGAVAPVRLLVQPYRGLAQSLRHRHKAARFVQVVHRAPGVTFILLRRAFPGEGVAVPAEQGEAAVQLALALGSLQLVPASTGFRFVPVMRRRVLVQPTPKGVVAVLDLELVVAVSLQAVEKMSGEPGLHTVVQPMAQVAPLVVGVMRVSMPTQHYRPSDYFAGARI